MIQSLFSGVSGMLTNQTEMDVIGNNIANANTTAFKGGTANFTESFLAGQPLGDRSTIRSDWRSVSARQVDSTTTNFNQGVFPDDQRPFRHGHQRRRFLLRLQSVSGRQLTSTRNGAFVEDSQGFLRTTDGNYPDGVMPAQLPPDQPVSTGFPPDKIQIPTTMPSPERRRRWSSYLGRYHGALSRSRVRTAPRQVAGYITLSKIR